MDKEIQRLQEDGQPLGIWQEETSVSHQMLENEGCQRIISAGSLSPSTMSASGIEL